MKLQALSVLVLSAALWSGEAAIAQIPLQPGTYWLGTSKSIRIIGSENKFCYIGYSKYGVSIASLLPVLKQPNVYRVHTFEGVLIMQQSDQVLRFGKDQMWSDYQLDPSSSQDAIIPEGTLCLKSAKPYFKQFKPGRG
ncbi:hypothetical protein BST81_24565 [Leptolyngbya sp. 'hensonii']|uniref:hypothetical protein n=1 Tax=Leptolyngbya sp. 'hensonii' TaxID=1922337 RepID=UPI00094F8DB3|nr:hypothetical protein [Leptolyngbya sp. 'hensonii']OLP15790.1 hypothetical protein BST81_24565 [Leptolyngbya sp. 'hensonii']